MTRVNKEELDQEMETENIDTWNDTLYKSDSKGKRVILANLTNSTWRVDYNDGTFVTGPENYLIVRRDGVKSISVLDNKKNIIHTVPVKDNWFICRKISLTRNFAKPGKPKQRDIELVQEYTFKNPKRAFALLTKGNYCYVWDDGDVDELDGFAKHTPYTQAKIAPLRDGESWE